MFNPRTVCNRAVEINELWVTNSCFSVQNKRPSSLRKMRSPETTVHKYSGPLLLAAYICCKGCRRGQNWKVKYRRRKSVAWQQNLALFSPSSLFLPTWIRYFSFLDNSTHPGLLVDLCRLRYQWRVKDAKQNTWWLSSALDPVFLPQLPTCFDRAQLYKRTVAKPAKLMRWKSRCIVHIGNGNIATELCLWQTLVNVSFAFDKNVLKHFTVDKW